MNRFGTVLGVLWMGAAATAGAQTPPPEPEPVVPPPAEVAPIAEPPPKEAKEAKPAVAVTYDGGLTFVSDDGKFELKLTNRMQVRADINKRNDEDHWRNRFIIPRARIQFDGWFYGKDNRFKLEFAYSDRGEQRLKDAFFDRKIIDQVWFRIGHFKRPVTRADLVSDFAGEFAEKTRFIEFGRVSGRDFGIALSNRYDSAPEGLEYIVSMQNGLGEVVPTTVSCDVEGDTATCPVAARSTVAPDWNPLFIARVGYNLGKTRGYSEGDFEGGGLRLAVGASYKLDMRGSSESGDWEHAVSGDVLVKVLGLDVLGGVTYFKPGGDDGRVGFYGQAGYFVLPKTAQVAGRFSYVPCGSTAAPACLGGSDNEHIIEGRVAFNFYLATHNLKWINDFGIETTTEDDDPSTPDDKKPIDFQWRSQWQLIF